MNAFFGYLIWIAYAVCRGFFLTPTDAFSWFCLIVDAGLWGFYMSYYVMPKLRRRDQRTL